jgi:hypothetical protein
MSCPDCGEPAAHEARACPSCGRLLRRRIWPAVLGGTALLLVGALVWLVASVWAASACEFDTAALIGVRAGFAAIVLGPLVGWIGVPVALRSRRRWVRWPVVGAVALLVVVVIVVAAAARLTIASQCS